MEALTFIRGPLQYTSSILHRMGMSREKQNNFDFVGGLFHVKSLLVFCPLEDESLFEDLQVRNLV